MLELRFLGTPHALLGGEILAGRAVQPRRVALLALLALAPHRTMARDKLLALLWPEADAAKGRHLLSGAVYDIRQSVGERLVARGDDLLLAAEGVSVDVAEFERLCGEGRHEEALRLRHGPLLDGFHISGAPDFERWVDRERARLDLAWRELVEAAARSRSAEGDVTGAVEAWRRLASEDPCSGRAALGFMNALAVAGERAEALRFADLHAARLKEEFGVEPHPDVAAFASSLRSAPPGSIAPPSGREPLPSPGRRPPDEPVAGPSGPPPDPGSGGGIERDPTLASGGRVDRAFSRPLAATLVATLAVVALVAWGAARALSGPPPRAGPTLVAVAPFTLEGDSLGIHLAWGMADLMSAKLNGAPGLRTVDVGGADAVQGDELLAAAVDAEADLLLSGHVLARAGGLVIRARLGEARAGGEILSEAVVQGEASAVFDLVDDLAAQLVSRALGSGDTLQLRRLASVTTESPLALRYYLEGERLVRWGKRIEGGVPLYYGAREAIERAVAIDSSFALAWYRLATMTVSEEASIDAAIRAVRHARRLPDPYPRLARAHLAVSRGDADLAEDLYRSIIADHPHLAEAQWRLGDLLYYFNPLRGRPVAEAEAVLREAARLEPNWPEGLGPLIWLSILEGEYARADSLVGAAGFEPLHWWALTAAGGPEEARVLQGLDSLNVWQRLTTAFWLVPLRGNVALARDLLEQDLAAAEADADGIVAPSLLFQLAYVEAAAGRPSAAREALRRLERLDPRTAAEVRAFLLLLPGWPASQGDLLEASRRLADAPAGHRVVLLRGSPAAREVSRQCLLARLRLAAGELGEAEGGSALDSLQRAEFPAGEAAHDCLVLVEAERASRAGAPPGEVLGILERTRGRTEPRLGTDPVYQRASERILRARLLARVGREDEALTWYGGLLVNPDLAWLPPVLAPTHLAMARLHDERGQLVEAIRHYEWVARLWSDAEDPFRAEVEHVRERLRGLTGG